MSRFINGDLVLDSSFYEEWSGNLNGDFSSGTARIVRIGKLVTISITDASHTSASSRSSGSGFVPSQFRPPEQQGNVVWQSGSILWRLMVDTAGVIVFVYTNAATGAGTNRTSIGAPTSISYTLS